MPASRLTFPTLFSLTQLILLNFLCLDFLRRVSIELEDPRPWVLFSNVAVVTAAGCLVALVVAAFLQLMEHLWPRLSQPLLFFAFYTVNLTFLKYRFVEAFESLEFSWRGGLCLVAAVLSLPAGWLARDFLTEVRDLVAAGGKTLALGLSLPFLSTALVLALVGPSRVEPDGGSRPARPHVLFVTVDTLAARDMSLYGYERPTTPRLERFAAEAICFDAAQATSNTTNTSIGAYLGYYFGSERPELDLVARLTAAGYRDPLWVSFHAPEFFGLPRRGDVQVVHSATASPIYGWLNRLFSTKELSWLAALASEEWPYFAPYDPRVGVEFHRYWKREHFSEEKTLSIAHHHLKAASQPTFVWVHLWQPHYPYFPKEPFLGKFDSQPLPYPPLNNSTYQARLQPKVDILRRRYDEYLAEVDHLLGQFFDQLKSDGILNHTVVVLGSDHGESFESGWVGHGGPFLHQSIVHIPLLLRLPDGPAGVRPQTFVNPVDLAPTLLKYLGEKVPSEMQGEDLLPYIKDPDRRSPRTRVSTSYFALSGKPGEIAVYSGRFKVVFFKDRTRHRVYDLVNDPREQRDLFQQYADQARAVAESVVWSVPAAD